MDTAYEQKTKSSSKEALLIAAAAVMSETGTVDFSLSEISDRSGVNSALVKYYFGNKLGLLSALAVSVVGPSIERLEELVETDLPPEEKMALHIRGTVNTYFNYPFVNRLLNRLGKIDDRVVAKKINTEISKPLAELQTRILTEGKAAGVFKDIDPMHFYFVLAGACEGLFQNQSALRDTFKVRRLSKDIKERYIEEVCAIVLQGIAKH